jgi:hypothetical protein
MIVFDDRKGPEHEEKLRAEFTGERASSVVFVPGHEAVTVIFSPRSRAMTVALAYELNRVFGCVYCVTHVLRTWEQEDVIYPTRKRLYGPGPQKQKPFSPHLPGRASDGYPKFEEGYGPGDAPYEKAMNASVEYLNKYFPYGWNNPSRGKTSFSTAIRHNHKAVDEETGKVKYFGDHLHEQESW